jgi:hypothetical protein
MTDGASMLSHEANLLDALGCLGSDGGSAHYCQRMGHHFIVEVTAGSLCVIRRWNEPPSRRCAPNGSRGPRILSLEP